MIHCEQTRFHLQGAHFSYLLQADAAGRLFHRYYGRKLRGSTLHSAPTPWHCWEVMDPDVKQTTQDLREHGFYSAASFDEVVAGLDDQQREYPEFGRLDLRSPAYQVENPAGDRISDLRLIAARVERGKPALSGLPAVRDPEGEGETLILTLADQTIGLTVELRYTVFDDSDCLCRSVRFVNSGTTPLVLHRALSMSLDLPQGEYQAVSLAGSWGRERKPVRRGLEQGRVVLESVRGGSSHQMNPFAAVCRPETTETTGEVWAANLVYSGNHMTVLEKDQYGMLRVQQGLSDEGFVWPLEPGAWFDTPECVLCYSCEGFGAMSRSYHDLYRRRIVRPDWRNRTRPVLINNWEGTYFDFTEEKILSIARKANEVGIELMVLDDGWFGKRDLDNCSLGDWVVNTKKLPNGITGLAEKVEALGMRFGLWFEPEMVNPDSDLYRAHPDWVIHTSHLAPALSRAQLTLDLSRPEVQEYIIDAVGAVLSSAKISYVKWDMNRHMTDMPSAGYNHRYYLGLYRVLETLTARFPEVLFESCSGGGGRFDAGMLYYMPQTWTSDDTDAIERLTIQYGTSLCYPLSAMGAHVTAVPNHQTGRVTPLSTRGDIALLGNFGYELDLTKLSQQELETVRTQVADCKALRGLMHRGDLYRLESPLEGNTCAFQVVDRDGSSTVLCYARILAVPNSLQPTVRLQGLDPAADYREEETGTVYGGDELMYAGLPLTLPQQDFVSVRKTFTRLSPECRR